MCLIVSMYAAAFEANVALSSYDFYIWGLLFIAHASAYSS